MTQKLNFVLGRVENIVGKGENAGHQHFLLFPTMFSTSFFSRGVKSWECVVIVKNTKFDIEMVRNIVGKEENASFQHFLIFPQCFRCF